jgi:hypothetical protein
MPYHETSTATSSSTAHSIHSVMNDGYFSALAPIASEKDIADSSAYDIIYKQACTVVASTGKDIFSRHVTYTGA